MTRIRPVAAEGVGPELQEAMARQRGQLGMVPNSLLTMAHRPQIAAAWAALAESIVAQGTVDPALKQLVAYVASTTHGCRYCQAHTAQNAHSRGVAEEKLLAAFEYESSDLFTEAERAALALAHAAALVPNEATDEHFDRLRAWFTDEQVVEIVAVISMFGFLNRWNDTMATTLEGAPRAFAGRTLSSSGWDIGAHGA